MAKILFSDTYTGPRFTYGLSYRPLAFAQVPDGWIIGSDRKHPEFRHGTVDYPQELTPEQVAAFQLTPIQPASEKEAVPAPVGSAYLAWSRAKDDLSQVPSTSARHKARQTNVKRQQTRFMNACKKAGISPLKALAIIKGVEV